MDYIKIRKLEKGNMSVVKISYIYIYNENRGVKFNFLAFDCDFLKFGFAKFSSIF